MKRTAIWLAAAVTCWSLAIASPTSADPTGTNYFVLLDVGIIDPASGATDLEGHAKLVMFDGLPDLVPNDLDPGPPPPFEHGNDLIVTEAVVSNPDGTETITVWIEADPPGDPLIVNTVDLAGSAFFDIGELHWDDPFMGGTVSEIEVLVTFPDDGVVVDPLSIDVFGLGTPSEPLKIEMKLNPSDFYIPFGEIDGTQATDLHVEFTVEHFPIPEPSSLVLTALAKRWG